MSKRKPKEFKRYTIKVEVNSPQYKFMEKQPNYGMAINTLLKLAIKTYGYTDLVDHLLSEQFKNESLNEKPEVKKAPDTEARETEIKQDKNINKTVEPLDSSETKAVKPNDPEPENKDSESKESTVPVKQKKRSLLSDSQALS
ncbi:hypothetical protein [Lactobacillus taiwanensis]|uniref:hypothetical protein n=1 Tax=Lactobacillus taiwanensis TaxID=508451 RepID=UPI001AEC1613|nr:hypothetical protein [Lactobacillus taiwanensis]QTQ40865.1 hypothetical protein H1A07_09305 [Lactobacillus taiwanensis]